MSVLSSAVKSLSGASVPALPCGLDAALSSLKTEIKIARKLLKLTYTPGALLATIAGLQPLVRAQLMATMGTKMLSLLPANLPLSLLDDVFKIGTACSLGATPECTTLLGEAASRYTSLGTADQAANAILSALTGEDVDVCSALPNINIGLDGIAVQLGVPVKIVNSAADVVNIPTRIADIGMSKVYEVSSGIQDRIKAGSGSIAKLGI